MLPNQPALLDETDRKLYTLLALRELGGCIVPMVPPVSSASP